MSSPAQPVSTLTNVVYQTWIGQLQAIAAYENAAALKQYQNDLANWNLNAPVFIALGKTGPAQPQPPMSVAVNLQPDGTVGSPNLITTSIPVCAPPPPPEPPPAPDPTPRLGAPMGAGFFAVPAGDSAPDGYVLTISGVSYQKHIVSTPFGTTAWYQQLP
jgi:hypothetical protein